MIDDHRRTTTHGEFWNLPRDRQAAWVIGTVTASKPNRPRKKPKGERVCKLTKKYYLTDEKKKKQRVCMKFYLRTLGYTHDTFIRNIFKSVNEQNKVLASPDKRGRHEPIHKLGLMRLKI